MAGTMQLGCMCVCERESVNYKSHDDHIMLALVCIHSTAFSSSLISSLLVVTSDLACSSCL